MVSLDIREVLPAFPAYRVALVVAADLSVDAAPDATLAGEVSEAEALVARDWGETELSRIPRLTAWREAYKRFGVKKTSYRSSVERLVKSIQQGRGLPRVNSLVDVYNLVSARHLMPVGADDLAGLEGSLAFRYARAGDSFHRLGDETGADNPPRSGEVVYADRAHILCRRWNWHQDARSAIAPSTTTAVLTVQSFEGTEAVEAAARDLCARLLIHCGARTAWRIADGDGPSVTVGTP